MAVVFSSGYTTKYSGDDTIYMEMEIEDAILDVKKRESKFSIMQLEDFDISDSLSDDVVAKLNLLHGDFIIIPKNKLEE